MINYKTTNKIFLQDIKDINSWIRNTIWRNLDKNIFPPEGQRRVLPDDFEYVWKTDRGVITKRIFKAIKDIYGIKLTDSILSELGQFLKCKFEGLEKEYNFIERKVNWRQGTYRDEGSCYWDSRKQVKKWINNANGFGICFYNGDYHKKNAVGRCLALPIKNSLFLFNAYGKYQLREIASMYAKYKNMRKVSINRVIRSNHDFWVNGNKGILLYSKTKGSRKNISQMIEFGTQSFLEKGKVQYKMIAKFLK